MKKIVFAVGILFFAGCSQQKKQKNLKELFYPSGSLKSQQWFYKDGIYIDTALYYYESGGIKSIEALNAAGKLSGVTKFFYENGSIHQILWYKDGKKNGFCYEFGKNGLLISKVFYVDDKQSGDTFWYCNKNIICEYNFFDFNENILNVRTYDTLKNDKLILNEYKHTFWHETNFSEDAILIKLILSNPPHCNTSVIVKYSDLYGAVIKQDTLINKPLFFLNVSTPDKIAEIVFEGIMYDSIKAETYKHISIRKK